MELHRIHLSTLVEYAKNGGYGVVGESVYAMGLTNQHDEGVTNRIE